MNIITCEDIKSVEFSIINNINILNFIEERNSITDHTKNILNPKRMIEQQITDCFIPFLVTHMSHDPYTYAEFIKKAHPDDRYISDTKERGSFDSFKTQVDKLEADYKNAIYIPPFVAYITQSIIPYPKDRNQAYRNYKYKFYNARSYSYIMRNCDCLPYFHKDKLFSEKEFKKYYTFYAETKDYPLIERIISQYYIDNYFSVYLFAQTVQLLNDEYKNRSLKKHFDSEESYNLYLDYFLYLCVLLQTSSGTFAKKTLFDTLHQIFFDVKNSKYLKLFKSSEKCFKQCAHEIVLYNEIVYPYIQNLYFKEFETILEKNTLTNKPDEIYKQLTQIVEIYINQKVYETWQSTQMCSLNDFAENLLYIENSIPNQVMNKFYDYVPFVPKNLIDDQTDSLSKICNKFSDEAFSIIDFKFYNIKLSYYNSIIH